MGLCIGDCREGTIVDHTFDRREEDGKIVTRDLIRRGIITKVVGNGKDAITEIWVKFAADGKAEKMSGVSLVRVYPASHKVAREAYRRIIGAPKHIGIEYHPKSSKRRRVQDSLALSAKKPTGLVEPEFDENEIGGMEVPDDKT